MDQQLTINVTKVISGPIAKVFNAWIDPEVMKKWYSPPGMTTPKAESERKVGGKYSITMAAGENEYTCSGSYLEIDEPNKLVFTWDATESVVTVLFK